MTEKEMIKITVEEFSRVQNYMLLIEKGTEAYNAIKQRYTELKVILMASGINLSELDVIKE
jgi:16S rRNA G966 N2-methylase RsmD